MSTLVLLDNEAVQALASVQHPKHRRVVAHMQVVAARKRKAAAVSVAVPTAVRAEAGWDRTDAGWAFANGLRIADIALDTAHANVAAGIRASQGVRISLADVHVGAAIRDATHREVVVLTSDQRDMRAVAGAARIRIVTI